MRKTENFPWSERTHDKLRAMWADGATTGVIALEIGCTRNAVIGKARRLGLEPRPSPIKPPNPNSHAKKPPRVVKLTFPSDDKRTFIRVARSPFLQPMPPPDVAFKDSVGPEVGLRSLVRKAERLPIPVGASPPSRTCQWTDSTRAPWVFCGCQAIAGYSWCADHKARVFDYRRTAA